MRIVLSAVNFTEGGPLTVLQECLRAACAVLPGDWEIVALVHDGGLVSEPRVRVIEVPDAKGSWLRRLWYEWVGFRTLTRGWEIDLWVSLHDITPRVRARRQVVYCHNPAPFYRLPLREARLEPSFFLFNRLYRYVYRGFIHRNRWVIVQQTWLRERFQQMFGDLSIVVAYPDIGAGTAQPGAVGGERRVFLYPALPRVFKNFETVMEAANLLSSRHGSAFELRVTLNGAENPYAQSLYNRYGNVPSIRFIGRQNREEMARQYAESDVIVFPSKLETWGLPISEAKSLGKPLLVADLPYARETVGHYDRVQFLHPTSPQEWAQSMEAVLADRWAPVPARFTEPAAPFVRGWEALWEFLANDMSANERVSLQGGR